MIKKDTIKYPVCSLILFQLVIMQIGISKVVKRILSEGLELVHEEKCPKCEKSKGDCECPKNEEVVANSVDKLRSQKRRSRKKIGAKFFRF